MKHARDLTREQLEDIVAEVQAILYADFNSKNPGEEEGDYWDPDKEWDVDFIEGIARKMTEYNLEPSLRERIILP